VKRESEERERGIERGIEREERSRRREKIEKRGGGERREAERDKN
jgi:hypothetical protein